MIVSFRKWILLSLTNIFRHPNHVKTYSKRNFPAMVVVQSFTGCAFAHLGKYLVSVMIYHMPVLLPIGCIGPIKSVAHFSNTYNKTSGFKGNSSLCEGFPILSQASYALQYAFESLCNVGHHKTTRKTLCAVTFPA